MSEPVDLTGMTPVQVRRAIRAAASTMDPPRSTQPKSAKPSSPPTRRPSTGKEKLSSNKS
jgi:hypothetical protein